MERTKNKRKIKESRGGGKKTQTQHFLVGKESLKTLKMHTYERKLSKHEIREKNTVMRVTFGEKKKIECIIRQKNKSEKKGMIKNEKKGKKELKKK